MKILHHARSIDLSTGDELVFGRGDESDLVLAVADGDRSISRKAGRFRFDRYAWHIENIGRRSFFVVQLGTERELVPDHPSASSTVLVTADPWIRVPSDSGDLAVVLEIEESECPPPDALAVSDGTLRTTPEHQVKLTDNELRSVVALYERYLELPPRYRREPNSFRAAARRLQVEEGKVKADLRRVQAKVARAGGPTAGGSRYRDALIQWLVSRRVVDRSDLVVLSISRADGNAS